ncbi:MAG TPA: DUF2190 family protein [Hyphomicrobium sp.]|nr:DUF2190 family protein [Hyphomicrobium sp.]
MKNFVQRGGTLTIESPGNYAAGEPVFKGGLSGIAASDVTTGDDLDLVTEGVFELPKAAEAIDVGDAMYWSLANKVVSTTSTDSYIGIAVTVGDAASPTVNVKLG